MSQRQKKLLQEEASFQRLNTPKSSAVREKFNKNDSTIMEQNDSWMLTAEDSFLEQERLCAELSRPLIDLSSSTEEAKDEESQAEEENKIIQELLAENKLREELEEKKKFQLKQLNDTTMLENIEAPSFFLSNTTILDSPTTVKSSPIYNFGLNRPSTIVEEGTIINSSAGSVKNQTLESFATAFTRNCSEATSDTYRTAQEDTYSSLKLRESLKRPATNHHFGDDLMSGSFEMDSLMKDQPIKMENITKDSLDDQDSSTIEISSSSEMSEIFDENQSGSHDSLLDHSAEPNFNDTLEKFEYMMAKGMKLVDKTPKNLPTTPKLEIPATPKTPDTIVKNKSDKSTYLSATTASSDSISVFPKTFTNLLHSKKQVTDPLSAKKAETQKQMDFKRPPQVHTKIPLPSQSKQFAHIVSPLSRYIKQTPTVPLTTTTKLQRQSGAITKLYNSRDSEISFKENHNQNRSTVGQNHVPSLPCRAKITSSNKQVSIFFQFSLLYFH